VKLTPKRIKFDLIGTPSDKIIITKNMETDEIMELSRDIMVMYILFIKLYQIIDLY
jgi:hypothetical protein